MSMMPDWSGELLPLPLPPLADADADFSALM